MLLLLTITLLGTCNALSDHFMVYAELYTEVDWLPNSVCSDFCKSFFKKLKLFHQNSGKSAKLKICANIAKKIILFIFPKSSPCLFPLQQKCLAPWKPKPGHIIVTLNLSSHSSVPGRKALRSTRYSLS